MEPLVINKAMEVSKVFINDNQFCQLLQCIANFAISGNLM